MISDGFAAYFTSAVDVRHFAPNPIDAERQRGVHRKSFVIVNFQRHMEIDVNGSVTAVRGAAEPSAANLLKEREP